MIIRPQVILRSEHPMPAESLRQSRSAQISLLSRHTARFALAQRYAPSCSCSACKVHMSSRIYHQFVNFVLEGQTLPEGSVSLGGGVSVVAMVREAGGTERADCSHA